MALLLRSWRRRNRGAIALLVDWRARRLDVVFRAVDAAGQLQFGPCHPTFSSVSSKAEADAVAAAAAAVAAQGIPGQAGDRVHGRGRPAATAAARAAPTSAAAASGSSLERHSHTATELGVQEARGYVGGEATDKEDPVVSTCDTGARGVVHGGGGPAAAASDAAAAAAISPGAVSQGGTFGDDGHSDSDGGSACGSSTDPDTGDVSDTSSSGTANAPSAASQPTRTHAAPSGGADPNTGTNAPRGRAGSTREGPHRRPGRAYTVFLDSTYTPLPDMDPDVWDWVCMKPREAGGALRIPPGFTGVLRLRVLLDASCVEVFTSTGQALTTRAYRGQPPGGAAGPGAGGRGGGGGGGEEAGHRWQDQGGGAVGGSMPGQDGSSSAAPLAATSQPTQQPSSCHGGDGVAPPADAAGAGRGSGTTVPPAGGAAADTTGVEVLPLGGACIVEELQAWEVGPAWLDPVDLPRWA